MREIAENESSRKIPSRSSEGRSFLPTREKAIPTPRGRRIPLHASPAAAGQEPGIGGMAGDEYYERGKSLVGAVAYLRLPGLVVEAGCAGGGFGSVRQRG
jgi:hypothetical protein